MPEHVLMPEKEIDTDAATPRLSVGNFFIILDSRQADNLCGSEIAGAGRYRG